MARPPKLSDEALTAALADRPGSTPADLSKLLGVGQSTAAKRLASLEATGAVRRTPGGRVEGVPGPGPLERAAHGRAQPGGDGRRGTGKRSPIGAARARRPGGAGARLPRRPARRRVRARWARQSARPLPGCRLERALGDGRARRGGPRRRQAAPLPHRQLILPERRGRLGAPAREAPSRHYPARHPVRGSGRPGRGVVGDLVRGSPPGDCPA